jgi:hypothetical protein
VRCKLKLFVSASVRHTGRSEQRLPEHAQPTDGEFNELQQEVREWKEIGVYKLRSIEQLSSTVTDEPRC